MNHGEPRKLADVIPVNPILESISSSVSALPVAGATGAQVCGSRGGGFAVTLAAVQNLAVPSSRSSHDESRAEQSLPGAAANSNPSVISPTVSAGQNPQPKKSSSGGSPMSANGVVPASTGLIVMSGIALPMSLAPSPSLPANPETLAPARTSSIATVSVGEVSGSGSQNLAQNAPASSLLPAVGAETGGAAVQSNRGVSSSAGLPLPTTASTLTEGQAPAADGSAASFFPPTVKRAGSTVTTANAASDVRQSSAEADPEPVAPTLMSAKVQASSILFASGVPLSIDGQPSPNESSTNATPPIPAAPAESIVETSQPIAAPTPELISWSSGSFAAGPVVVAQQSSSLETSSLKSASVQSAMANFQRAPSNAADGGGVSASAVPAAGTDPASQPVVASEAANQLAAMVNAGGQSPIASAVSSSLPAHASARPVAAKSTAEDATENRSSVPAPPSVSSRGSSSVGGVSTTSQTPFAVFFSDPGAGATSAVSALPKVILPANAATHTSSSVPSVAPGGNTPSNLHNNVAPNVGAQTGKETPSASQSENSPAAPTPRKDADANGANATLDLASSSVAPVVATPAPAATVPVAVVPQSSVPAVAGDPLPKADGTQAGAENSGIPVPVTPQAVAVALPGPVQMAHMVNRVGQAEMRIGMNTSAFGSVEVRTVVHASDVGVIIGSEKGDLRTLLANEMPVITSSLQQQSLRLNSVNFMQGFAFSNNQSGGGESQQRSFVPAPSPANSGSHEVAGDDTVETPPPLGFVGSSSSLSILA